MYKIYQMNENYFSKINSHEKAYILGFIYADGCVRCDSEHHTLEINQNGEKKLKFEKIFCASEEKSSEDTSLIAGTPEMAISSEASIEERSSTIPETGVEPSDSKCEAPNLKEKGEDIVSSAIK